VDERDHERRDGAPAEGPADRPGTDERRRANVDVVIHHTLAAGVAVGFALLVVGLVLTVAGRGGLAMLSLKAPAAWRAALHLRAAGFYSLGLLVLILTPFVRVVGSIVAFAAARDWRFVAVTCAVLAVMIASIVIGAA
jgi:uncharacterized membrane protein